jgi:hypothetical protein
VNCAVAAARTEHRRLLEVSILLHDVQRAPAQPLRKAVLDDSSPKRWVQPFVEPVFNAANPAEHYAHAPHLSESSIKPQRG